jgi:hypothetical protein
MDATTRLARLVGPSLAGLLAAAAPVPSLMAMNALSFAASAWAVKGLARALPAPPRPAAARPRLEAWLVGLKAVAGHPALIRLLAVESLISGLWTLALWVCLPLAVQRQAIGGGGLEVVGLVMGGYGLGNLLGNLMVGHMDVRRPVRMVLLGGLVVGAGLLVMGLTLLCAPRALVVPLLTVTAALTALGGPMADIPMATLRQTEFAPDEVAPVYRIAMACDWAGVLLATAAGPLLLAHAAPGVVMTACGSTIVLAAAGVIGLCGRGGRQALATSASGGF